MGFATQPGERDAETIIVAFDGEGVGFALQMAVPGMETPVPLSGVWSCGADQAWTLRTISRQEDPGLKTWLRNAQKVRGSGQVRGRLLIPLTVGESIAAGNHGPKISHKRLNEDCRHGSDCARNWSSWERRLPPEKAAGKTRKKRCVLTHPQA